MRKVLILAVVAWCSDDDHVVACKESYPRDPSGACPGTIPCP